MAAVQETVDKVKSIDVGEYKYGFVTDIESEKAPKGLNEDIVRFISAKKNEPEWMTEWRLDAYRRWLTMQEPKWARVHYPPIDYQDLYYYSAPKNMPALDSLDQVDPELLRTYEKLGIPLREQEILAGVKPSSRVAVDAVFDSVSVATTFKAELAKAGVIFCPISEALRDHPDLVRKYLGTVVPATDNYFATLNSAVFSDGSFVYVPPGVRCPMELSTYFRINEQNTGQFERTLIIADKGSYVSYLEARRLHGAQARREPVARRRRRTGGDGRRRDQIFDGAELVSRRFRGPGGHLQFRDEARRLSRRPLEDLVDAGRDRLGHHLEISKLHPARRILARRVLLHRHFQRHAAGRFRHQDDPSR